MLFSVGTLDRMETQVHQLAIVIAGSLGIGLHLRIPVPDRLRGENAAPGQYPHEGGRERAGGHRKRLSDATVTPATGTRAAAGTRHAALRIPHRGGSQIILAIHTAALVAEAKRTGGVIRNRSIVGDFVAKDERSSPSMVARPPVDEGRLPR